MSTKNYDWGDVQEKIVMCEAMTMVKFSSYKYLAAFLLSPFKEETAQTKTWLRQVPQFTSD